MAEHHNESPYWQVRRGAAWWRDPNQELIEVSGKDAGSYLHSQLTQDVLGLQTGHSAMAALVDRKGHLQALMQLCRVADETFWLLPSAGSETLFRHLEHFHFVEELEVTWQTEWTRLHLEGPACQEMLQALSGQKRLPLLPGCFQSLAFPGGTCWLMAESLSGERGVQLLCRVHSAQSLSQQLLDLGLPELMPEELVSLSIESGYPRWGIDMTEQTLLPETGLEKVTVNYEKGCYLGQEVIARIRSYGVVPRGLIGLYLPASVQPGPLRLDGKDIGRLTSVTWSPILEKWIGLAYLHKSQRENGKQLSLELDGQALQAEVRRLPFYTPASASEQAQDLLEQALNVFAEGDEAQAIPLLEAALSKDPHLKDAYESLGVILSRLGRTGEAIEVMQQLAALDPEEPMAQTNLSRFYMLMGDKATAELHMAEATRLNMLRTRQQILAEQQAEQERAQKLELMQMFREVLAEEDPEDLVANFGLGKALLDLGQSPEAIPYLEKATQIEPLYSAAWLQLGKALEQTGDLRSAKQVYGRGIEAASEKGDLMPLKEMEQRRMALGGVE